MTKDMSRLIEIDKIIWDHWNPLQLEDRNSTKYDEHITYILDALEKNKDVPSIVEYLREVERTLTGQTDTRGSYSIILEKLSMLEPTPQSFSPWRSIWFKPRKTISYLQARYDNHLFFLTCLIGISRFVDRAIAKDMGDHYSWPIILLLAIILSPLLGAVYLIFISSLMWIGGKIFGGKASFQEVRLAFAWSTFPALCGLIFLVPQIAMLGQSLFASEMIEVSEQVAILFDCSVGVEIFLGLWSLIILLPCLSQVQEFSLAKTIGSIFVPLILFVGLVALTIYFE